MLLGIVSYSKQTYKEVGAAISFLGGFVSFVLDEISFFDSLANNVSFSDSSYSVIAGFFLESRNLGNLCIFYSLDCQKIGLIYEGVDEDRLGVFTYLL